MLQMDFTQDILQKLTSIRAALQAGRTDTLNISPELLRSLEECAKSPNKAALTEALAAAGGTGRLDAQSEELFNEVLLLLQFQEISETYQIKTVRLSRTSVRGMIGKWYPPTKGQMTIRQVVDDILIKVEKNVKGCYYYYTGLSRAQEYRGRFSYQLVVNDRFKLFIDPNRKICYQILNALYN